MEKRPYQLVVRFNFNAVDDVEARAEAAKMQKHYYHAKAQFKLQAVYDDKPPRSIRIPEVT